MYKKYIECRKSENFGETEKQKFGKVKSVFWGKVKSKKSETQIGKLPRKNVQKVSRNLWENLGKVYRILWWKKREKSSEKVGEFFWEKVGNIAENVLEKSLENFVGISPKLIERA